MSCIVYSYATSGIRNGCVRAPSKKKAASCKWPSGPIKSGDISVVTCANRKAAAIARRVGNGSYTDLKG